MGIFDKNEEKLKEQIRQLKQDKEKLEVHLRETDKSVSYEMEQNKILLQQINILKAKLNETTPVALPDTLMSRLMQILGAFFVLLSLMFVYFLATRDTFIVNAIIIWSAYIVTQLLGLYLLGFGKKLTYVALQRFGAYMSALFLLICSYMAALLFGLINSEFNLNLIGLSFINAVGIFVLIYAERQSIRLQENGKK
jgi:hypothetical protein